MGRVGDVYWGGAEATTEEEVGGLWMRFHNKLIRPHCYVDLDRFEAAVVARPNGVAEEGLAFSCTMAGQKKEKRRVRLSQGAKTVRAACSGSTNLSTSRPSKDQSTVRLVSSVHESAVRGSECGRSMRQDWRWRRQLHLLRSPLVPLLPHRLHPPPLQSPPLHPLLPLPPGPYHPFQIGRSPRPHCRLQGGHLRCWMNRCRS